MLVGALLDKSLSDVLEHSLHIVLAGIACVIDEDLDIFDIALDVVDLRKHQLEPDFHCLKVERGLGLVKEREVNHY